MTEALETTGAPVVIVGGGPGGAAAALHLAAAGVRSIIVEKDEFPRFHIGESMTGESGQLMRELGLEPTMQAMGYPVKYGGWIYFPGGRKWWIPVKRRTPEGQLQDASTWQVRRSTFDKILLDHVREQGIPVVRGRARAPLVAANARVRGVTVEFADGRCADLESDVLVDASGQHTFLATAGVAGPKERGRYARQIAIYGHFRGAVRDPGDQWGNTLIYFTKKYHWAWFIPIDEGITSVGFVVPSEDFRACREPIEQFLLRQLHEFHRGLSARLKHAELIDEAHATSNYSYEVREFVGDGWLCIGDAHRFIDPLFSFGLNITLAEARRAAEAVTALLAGDTGGEPFRAFAEWSNRGVDLCQLMVDAFWASSIEWGFTAGRHGDEFIDILAGRVWDHQGYAAVAELRELVAKYGDAPLPA